MRRRTRRHTGTPNRRTTPTATATSTKGPMVSAWERGSQKKTVVEAARSTV